MVEIPENTVTEKDLADWYVLTEKLSSLKAQEALLRPRIYRHFFPNPVEGTNTYILPDKHQLKAVRKIDRKVDEPAMFAFRAPEVVEGVTANATRFEVAGIIAEELFKPKYELVTSAYRNLTDEQRKIVDQVLIIKDGSPQLTITKPSTKAPKNVSVGR